MVKGLDLFRDYFIDYTDQYVLIGGTAVDIHLSDEGLPFRLTKDLDIVIIVEALTKEFVDHFWSFIKLADYNHQNKSGENNFYRFLEPTNEKFPYMIEILSFENNIFNEPKTQPITRLSTDDEVVSLSAIMLDANYYKILKANSIEKDGIMILNDWGLILFKIKAHLNLKDEYENGSNVGQKDRTKHRKDVFRIMQIVVFSGTMDVATEIQNDVKRFIELDAVKTTDLKTLGILGNRNQYLEQIKEYFKIK